jgi:hypothetical protein
MCRRSARSSGQQGKSAYSYRIWKAGSIRAAGRRAKTPKEVASTVTNVVFIEINHHLLHPVVCNCLPECITKSIPP